MPADSSVGFLLCAMDKQAICINTDFSKYFDYPITLFNDDIIVFSEFEIPIACKNVSLYCFEVNRLQGRA